MKHVLLAIGLLFYNTRGGPGCPRTRGRGDELAVKPTNRTWLRPKRTDPTPVSSSSTHLTVLKRATAP